MAITMKFFRDVTPCNLVRGTHKIKVKVTLEKAMKAQGGVELYYFFNLDARWGGRC